MTSTHISSASGLRRVQAYNLDTTGYPDGDQSGATGYDGFRVSGAQSFTLTIPDIQPLVHLGDDIAFAYDYLPANAAVTAAMNTGKTDFEAMTNFTDTDIATIGDAYMVGLHTDKQGAEPDVCFMVTRQALDTDPTSASLNTRNWQTILISKGRAIPKGAPADQGALDINSYNIVPTPVSQPPWGKPFTLVTNGFTRTTVMLLHSQYPLFMERWTGNATRVLFNLAHTAISTTKTAVFVNGTAATVSSVDTTIGASTMTLSAPPANDSVVVALYESSDNP